MPHHKFPTHTKGPSRTRSAYKAKSGLRCEVQTGAAAVGSSSDKPLKVDAMGECIHSLIQQNQAYVPNPHCDFIRVRARRC